MFHIYLEFLITYITYLIVAISDTSSSSKNMEFFFKSNLSRARITGFLYTFCKSNSSDFQARARIKITKFMASRLRMEFELELEYVL